MARKLQKPLAPEALLAQVRQMMAAGERTTPADLSRVEKLERQLERERKEAQAYIIASLGDQPLPVKFFAPWASYARINQAENDGTLTTIVRRNGKVMITAAHFFAWFNSLPADVKRKKAATK